VLGSTVAPELGGMVSASAANARNALSMAVSNGFDPSLFRTDLRISGRETPLSRSPIMRPLAKRAKRAKEGPFSMKGDLKLYYTIKVLEPVDWKPPDWWPDGLSPLGLKLHSTLSLCCLLLLPPASLSLSTSLRFYLSFSHSACLLSAVPFVSSTTFVCSGTRWGRFSILETIW
jgi:hypothetical protein